MDRRERAPQPEPEDDRRTLIEEREFVDEDTGPVGDYEERTHYRAGPGAFVRMWFSMLAMWAGLALAVVETLLGFRLGFRLANANPNNGFVDFIYDITGPMIEPFEGIASNRSVDGGVLEPATVIAMVVFLVAGLLLMTILWMLSALPAPAGERPGGGHTHVRTRRTLR